MLCLNYCIFTGSAEALVRCGGKQQHLLIAYFIGNTYAKYYENPTMLSRVTAKNVGDVFLRHTVVPILAEVDAHDTVRYRHVVAVAEMHTIDRQPY